jgi:hypothetical protein
MIGDGLPPSQRVYLTDTTDAAQCSADMVHSYCSFRARAPR